ncbi:MAG: hypothetical protein KFH87_05465 [Bacteroidetes bacterium]|nr:hypothetical protein [Bacteroidota bacterium]
MRVHLLTSIFVSMLLTACGGTKTIVPEPEAVEFAKYRYAANATMTREPVATDDGRLRVLRPDGWMRTADPKNAPSILLWLVREDYSASISFAPINMDPTLYQTLRDEGIAAVASVSLRLKDRHAEDSISVVQPIELFKVGGRICAAYEYRLAAADPVIRVVVFDTGTRFLECVLFPSSMDVTPAENRRLFEVQQTVLASMNTHAAGEQ